MAELYATRVDAMWARMFNETVSLAVDIAEQGAVEVDEEEEWMSLGVWAMVQGDQTESNHILQFAVNKDGIVQGNYYNAVSDKTTPINGSIDKKTQRLAFTVGDNTSTVCETGIYNLTSEKETQMLMHKGKDVTQQWLLVMLEPPDTESGEGQGG